MSDRFDMPPMQYHPDQDEFSHADHESCKLDGIGKLGHLFRAGFSLINTASDGDTQNEDIDWDGIDEFAAIVDYIQERNRELCTKHTVSTTSPLVDEAEEDSDRVYFDEGSVDVDGGSMFSIEMSINALQHTYNNVLEERIGNRNEKIQEAARRLTNEYHTYCELLEDDLIEVFTACIIPGFTFKHVRQIEDDFDIELIEKRGNSFGDIKKAFEKKTDSVLLLASNDGTDIDSRSIDGINPSEFGYEYPIECLAVREVTESFLEGETGEEATVETHPVLPWYGALSCNCGEKSYYGWLLPVCRHEMHVINVISNGGMGLVDSENRLPQRFKRVTHPESFTEVKEIL